MTTVAYVKKSVLYISHRAARVASCSPGSQVPSGPVLCHPRCAASMPRSMTMAPASRVEKGKEKAKPLPFGCIIWVLYISLIRT